MKRDFCRQLKAISGEGIREAKTETVDGKDVETLVPLTLKTIAINALLGVYAKDAGLSGEAKMQRVQLAQRVYLGTVIDVSPEDIVLLKSLINLRYEQPQIVAAAWQLLDADYEEDPISFGDNFV